MAVSGDLTPAEVLAGLDEIEVVVEKLVAGGDGLARVQGVPIFIPLSAPGDRLRIRLVRRAAQYGRGQILEILEPGAGRRSPPCRHFSVCGGCDLQHLEDDLQSRLKAQAARETLRRLGGFANLPPSRLVQGRAWGYRTRAQFRTAVRDGELEVGYFARGSHDLVAVKECPILAPELQQQLQTLTFDDVASAPRRIDLAVGDDGATTCAPLIEGQPRGSVRRVVAGISYTYDAGAFFQVHADLLEDLVASVVGPWSGKRAFDLYAGVGLFSLQLAKRYERVTAVESERVAARWARLNARDNGLRNVEVHQYSLETSIQALPEDADRVVVNPPRAGLSRRVRNMIKLRAPKRLTYLSCHPASLARDLQSLDERYEIESLSFFDLFPQTGHIETLVQLVLEGR